MNTNGTVKSKPKREAVRVPERVLGPSVQGILGFQHPEHNLEDSGGKGGVESWRAIRVTELVYLDLSCC